MTDNEIIKSFECCAQGYYCTECPLIGTHNCIPQMSENAINLIKHQKAEIERLHSEVKEKTETIVFLKDQATGWSIDFCNLKAKLNTAKSEAIKEFAERLKQSAFDCDVSFGYGREHYTEAVAVVEIDNLVKEMTEGKYEMD